MSKFALGTVNFGLDYGISSTSGYISPEEVKKVLNYASSKDINFLDTAYDYGVSEKILGKSNILDFNVITKTRNFENLSTNDDHLRYLKNDFESSLSNLKLDKVYAVLIHNSEDLLKPYAKKLFDELKYLKKSKKIKKIGVSVYDYIQLQSIIDRFDIDIVQIPINIFDKRMIESGMIDKLKKKNIEVHARSIFLQGLLLMSEKNRPTKFNNWNSLWKLWDEWLSDNKITALEATTRYALSLTSISKIVVGVDNKCQLEEIILASKGKLPQIPNELSTNDVDLLNPSNWNKL
jgi:aryl-alcohol dehydrogenase-like predicted oxidoreductase